MTAVRRSLSILLASVTATAMLAQGQSPATTRRNDAPAPRTTPPVTAETDQDVQNPRAMQLTLEEAIRTAIEHNLGIRLQSYEFAMAGQNLRGSYGAFDPVATAEIRRSSSEAPTVSQFQPSGSSSTQVNFGFGQFLPTGGSYNLGFTNSRGTQSGGGTSINPAIRSGLQLAFDQPLLRNFGLDVNRRGILIARNTLGINRESFRNQLRLTTDLVTQAYLNLVYARRAVDVVKESLFLAGDQARIVQIRIDVGAAAPLDILQPRVQIATVEEQLIRSVATVRDAEDQLRALMNLAPGEWDRPIIPTDPVEYRPIDINTEAAVARALAERPEVRQQNLFTETARILEVYARNQRLPEVNLGVGYNLNGLAGRALEFNGNGQPTGNFNTTRYPDALQQLFRNDFPSWNVGLTVAVPISNIQRRAEARRAELEVEQSLLDTEQVRQNIAVEVRNFARAVDTAARAISATRTSREAAERNLDAERRRYENGMTTNFQVLQIQQQLTDARVRELNALVEYAKAVSAFHRSTGDILGVHNISDDAPDTIQEPRMAFSFLDRYEWLNFGHLQPIGTTDEEGNARRSTTAPATTPGTTEPRQ